MRLILILPLLITLASSKPTFLLDSLLIHKAAQLLGIGNVVSVEGDVRAKVGDNHIGINAAGGIGGDVVGYHAAADADVLGQKANINANIYDGKKVDANENQIHIDANGRQYALVREYVGTQLVYRRKYIDAEKIEEGTIENLPKIITTEVNSGKLGVIEFRRSDGYIQVQETNGIIKIRRTDGVVIQVVHTDGTIELVRPDGYIEVRRITGIIEIRRKDGVIVEVHHPDGLVEVLLSDGNVEIHRPNGIIEIRRPNGDLLPINAHYKPVVVKTVKVIHVLRVEKYQPK